MHRFHAGGRTPGYAATRARSSLLLRTHSRLLSGGYVSVAFERGWRNFAVGRRSGMGDTSVRIAATRQRGLSG